MLKTIEKKIGEGLTTGDQINMIGKQYFGSKFKGIFPIRGPQDVPQLKEGEVAILNKDVHWWPVWKKDGKLYEGDSFNRDLLGAKYRDVKQPPGFKQKLNESNCGPRAITNAYFALQK